MRPDIYGRTLNYSLYFDTPQFLLARRSMEKPSYKEKLRIRSYGTASASDPVFVELKKKYAGITYKRRICMREREAYFYMRSGICCCPDQVTREIDYFRLLYRDLSPRVLISYDREAFYELTNADFRVTFDRDILWRDTQLNLQAGNFGAPLLHDRQVLMEVKTGSAIPLWMTKALSDNHIYRTSFSKYGNACRAVFSGAAHKQKGYRFYA